ncbi:cyclic nucleotide-binding domain-containing protein [candidate division TA06 bacterium]|uniref:Cyclic nucleotide-binding domain-containing protein n=1 Tax=candidate division TA06 bacterium TaxID=2250710 RepID=A0A933IAQ2_UNCT6|nr:cyclic nucleotide-binding domain-containing protein [candidate division TA06 bacterium]
MAPTDVLKKVCLFKYLSFTELEALQDRLEKRAAPKGEKIFNEGSQGNEMYLITKGEVEISISRNESKLVLAELQESSFFGEMSIITDKPRTATAVALVDSDIYVLTKEEFQRLLVKEPLLSARILLAIAEILCDRIQSTNENLETYFLINRAIVDNEQFRRLYIQSHLKA